jgi:DNA-binding CsgD family transcriptional regulator
MAKIASLLVARDGTVTRANAVAEELLRARVGARCCDTVRLVSARGGLVCGPTCVLEIAERPGPPVERRGTLEDGRRASVTCGRLGHDVLVNVTNVSERADVRETLTPREIEVLRLVAEGLTNRLVGRRLALRPATVRTHMEHVREKLGVRTRAQAVARASALGTLDDAP